MKQRLLRQYSKPNPAGTKHSPINQRSKIHSCYLIIWGEGAGYLHIINPSSHKKFIVWDNNFVNSFSIDASYCTHICTWTTTKKKSIKNLKILQSTGYIKHGLIFGLLWEIPERKIPFIHTALLLEKYTRFHAETQCRTGHLFQSTCSLVLFSVNLKQEGKW